MGGSCSKAPNVFEAPMMKTNNNQVTPQEEETEETKEIRARRYVNAINYIEALPPVARQNLYDLEHSRQVYLRNYEKP